MPAPPEPSRSDLIAGADHTRSLDMVFVDAPLRDYTQRPRVNDFTLPVLGMGYLATYAAAQGFNVGVLDAEAHGLGLRSGIDLINSLAPRWAGFNLLAPTYELSARIAAALDPSIKVMLGGHQAKAMPTEILTDPRMARCDALVLVLGEGETRVAALLADHRARADLPGVMWLDPVLRTPVSGGRPGNAGHLAPDINTLPFVDRRFLAQDPHLEAGRWEANMVGARGCPYNCSFCGAAVSATSLPRMLRSVRFPGPLTGSALMTCSSDAWFGLAWCGWRLSDGSVEVVGRTGGGEWAAPPVLPAWGTVLGWRVRRAEAVLLFHADHIDKTTAVQTVPVDGAQSVPRYSGFEYSAGY